MATQPTIGKRTICCSRLISVALLLTMLLGVGQTKSAFAATFIVSNQASCEAIGGEWIAPAYCSGSITVKAGDTVIFNTFASFRSTTNSGIIAYDTSDYFYPGALTNNVGATLSSNIIIISGTGVNYGTITTGTSYSSSPANLYIAAPFTNASTGVIILPGNALMYLGADVNNQGTILLGCGAIINYTSHTITGNRPYAPDCTGPTANPTQSPTVVANGWTASDVTVTWRWSDNVGGSGLDNANCTSSSQSSGEGEQTLTATCRDRIGNTGSASYTVKVDKTAPVVTVSGVNNGASYMVGSVPTAACNTTDPLAGVATPATVMVTGGNGDGTGSFTATCSGATDSVGNSTAPVSVSYTVNAPTPTPTNTSVPPTATPTNTPVPPATTLYATGQQVRNSLATLLPSGNSKTDQSLQKAIAKLDQGLSPAFWQLPAGNHLSSQGEKAFHRLRDAIKELRKLNAPPAAVTAAIDTVTGLGRTLAEQAIAAATTAGGNAKQLAKATKEMTKAQQDLANQRPDLAFAHYEEAWQAAQSALGVVLAASEPAEDVIADDLDHVHDDLDGEDATGVQQLFLPLIAR